MLLFPKTLYVVLLIALGVSFFSKMSKNKTTEVARLEKNVQIRDQYGQRVFVVGVGPKKEQNQQEVLRDQIR